MLRKCLVVAAVVAAFTSVGCGGGSGPSGPMDPEDMSMQVVAADSIAR
jgi:hypothetical protein